MLSHPGNAGGLERLKGLVVVQHIVSVRNQSVQPPPDFTGVTSLKGCTVTVFTTTSLLDSLKPNFIISHDGHRPVSATPTL